jgi:hypothetical protein
MVPLIPITKRVDLPTYPGDHPWVTMSRANNVLRGPTPAMVTMYGPAGLVGPVGATDKPYVGMDPSDPVTWVRGYAPGPGMMPMFNYDGAQPNQGQVVARAPRLAQRIGGHKMREMWRP